MLEQATITLADLFQFNLVWILIGFVGAYLNWRKGNAGTAWFCLFVAAVIIVWTFGFLLAVMAGVISV